MINIKIDICLFLSSLSVFKKKYIIWFSVLLNTARVNQYFMYFISFMEEISRYLFKKMFLSTSLMMKHCVWQRTLVFYLYTSSLPVYKNKYLFASKLQNLQNFDDIYIFILTILGLTKYFEIYKKYFLLNIQFLSIFL